MLNRRGVGVYIIYREAVYLLYRGSYYTIQGGEGDGGFIFTVLEGGIILYRKRFSI